LKVVLFLGERARGEAGDTRRHVPIDNLRTRMGLKVGSM